MVSRACIIGDLSVNSTINNLYKTLEINVKSNVWTSITFCSAYLTSSAAESLIRLFKLIDTRKRLKINLMVGSKDYFTHPDAIKTVLDFFTNHNKKNIEYNFIQPLDTSFHIKCYIFLGPKLEKMLLGSANLTTNGLNSFGELLVEISDSEIVNQVVNHLDYYYTNSVPWEEAIKEYSLFYKKFAPKVNEEVYHNYSKALTKRIGKSTRSIMKKTIRFASPTIVELYSLESKKIKRINEAIANLKRPELAKNWILFEDLSYDEIANMYPIDSWFDRPQGHNRAWAIGTKRLIGRVGDIILLNENEVVLLMKKYSSIHYMVSERILEMAERLGIKSEDEEAVPLKKNLDKYCNFILKNRKN